MEAHRIKNALLGLKEGVGYQIDNSEETSALEGVRNEINQLLTIAIDPEFAQEHITELRSRTDALFAGEKHEKRLDKEDINFK